MYTQFFGLKKKPFSLSPDPEFFYFSKKHDLAFTHLEYGLVHNVGFIALTGDVGTGKTTLLKYLLNRIRAPLDIAMIFNTQIDPHSFLEMLAKEFEITPASNRKSDLYEALYQYFLGQYAKRVRCVIFVDEAQNLSVSGFEELRMLSNLDSGSEPLVQIILAGQPQLRNRLADASLAQLTQRISVHYHLSPMLSEDIGKYINHRLFVAGSQRESTLFEKEAVDKIAEVSGGVPRIINSICDASLTYAFADGLETVSMKVVENVVSDNELMRAGAERHSAGGSHDGGDPRKGLGLESHANSGEAGVSGFGGLISNLMERISYLEARVSEAQTAEAERSIVLLQEMLAGEREKTVKLAAQLVELKKEYKRVVKELQKIGENQQSLVETGHFAKTRLPWRIFSRDKK
jgi:general secretion pathway protein A